MGGVRARWATIPCVLMLAATGCGNQAARPGPVGRFPQPAAQRSAVLWAVGDGDGSADSGAVTDVIRRGRPARLLYLGDVYPAGSAADFRERYATTFGRLRSLTWPTPGNHEWPAHATGYEPFWSAVIGGRPPSYYERRVAGWQILSLNSEEPGGPATAQGRWLSRRVGGTSTCRLAFWHRPRFSAGLHGDQAEVAPLWDAVVGRAALVVNGHDHDMQQLKPFGPTTEVVVGSGGHGHYPVNRADPRLAWSNATTYGALRIALRPGRADLTFFAADGRPLHATSVGCRA